MKTITWAAVGSVCLLFAMSSRANAQSSSVACKPTETQAECHARLRCKAYEEVEECQRRLASERSGSDSSRDTRRGDDRGRDRAGGRDSARGRGDDARGRGGRDRGDRRGGSRGRRHRGGGSRSFVANKTFGIGFELGEPTGLTGKYFVSDSGAIDFGLGWIYRHYYYGNGAHLYADYLWHPTSLASTDGFELPFYIGLGLRFWDFDYCVNNFCDYGGSAIGVRMPLGIAFDFNRAPLDIFLQLVPVLDFIRGDYYDRYRDRTHLGIDFSAGIRFWF